MLAPVSATDAPNVIAVVLFDDTSTTDAVLLELIAQTGVAGQVTPKLTVTDVCAVPVVTENF